MIQHTDGCHHTSKQHIKCLEQRLTSMEALIRCPTQKPENEEPEAAKVTTEPPRSASIQDLTINFRNPRQNDQDEECRNQNPPPPLANPPESLRTLRERLDVALPPEIHVRYPIIKEITDRINSCTSVQQPRALTRVPPSPIVPAPVEIALLHKSCHDAYAELPLFRTRDFLERLVKQPESLGRRAEPAWWISLNTSIALASFLNAVNRDFSLLASIPWSFFKNAFSALPELMLHEDGLPAAQAVLAMAIFMRASADTRTATRLLSIAVGLLHAATPAEALLSYPTSLPGRDIEEEERRRVSSVAYVLDADMSINNGLLPLLHAENWESEPPTQSTGSYDTVFGTRCKLAEIQYNIQRRLYSAKALRSLDRSQLNVAVSELNVSLESWRAAVSPDVQFDGCDGRTEQDSALEMPDLEMPKVMLYLTYYSCLSMVHWAGLRDATLDQISIPSTEGQSQAMASFVQLRAAARNTIYLFRRVSIIDFVEVW